MSKFYKFIAVLAFTAMISGCSTKKSDELFNLSPDAWYSQIIKDIKDSDLEEAQKHYVSFSSEHIASPLLEEITLILAQANVDDEKYTEANSYLDEYIRRYGTEEKIEYAKFLKIKANFDSFSKPNRNQKLMQNSIRELQKFIFEYPRSQYRPLADTMLVKLKLAEHKLNKEIKELYERTGRDDSAEIYAQKIENSGLDDTDMIGAKLPWYREIFE